MFKPLLYELLSGAASAEEVAPTYAQLLGPYPVAFVQGRVASVQPEHSTEVGSPRSCVGVSVCCCGCLHRCFLAAGWMALDWLGGWLAGCLQDGGSAGGGVVVLSDGAQVAYDWLVVSLGAETSTFGIPGVKELALPFSTYQDAQRVRRFTFIRARQCSLLNFLLCPFWAGLGCDCGCASRITLTGSAPHRCTPVLHLPQVVARLQALEAGGGFPEVVVVGGGYAGVELAATVAERLQGRGRIKLVTSTPEILDSSPQVRAAAWCWVLLERGAGE